MASYTQITNFDQLARFNERFVAYRTTAEFLYSLSKGFYINQITQVKYGFVRLIASEKDRVYKIYQIVIEAQESDRFLLLTNHYLDMRLVREDELKILYNFMIKQKAFIENCSQRVAKDLVTKELGKFSLSQHTLDASFTTLTRPHEFLPLLQRIVAFKEEMATLNELFFYKGNQFGGIFLRGSTYYLHPITTRRNSTPLLALCDSELTTCYVSSLLARVATDEELQTISKSLKSEKAFINYCESSLF